MEAEADSMEEGVDRVVLDSPVSVTTTRCVETLSFPFYHLPKDLHPT